MLPPNSHMKIEYIQTTISIVWPKGNVCTKFIFLPDLLLYMNGSKNLGRNFWIPEIKMKT